MLRPVAIALGIWAVSGCAAAPRPAPPPPPPGFAEVLPPDAPLTAVVRPAALRAGAARIGLDGHIPLPGLELDPVEPLVGLGIDPQQPVWISLRAGPVLGVLRAAEDAARVLADAEPLGDPRWAPGEPLPAGPFDRWLQAHPLPPAWIHLRLVGHPQPVADGQTAIRSPDAWLTSTAGALAVARASDPTETMAATLDVELGPAGAIQAALGGIEPTVYRLLDRPLPTLVAVHRRGGSHPATVVDVVWDLDLGPGGLAAGMAALPEAGGVWGARRAVPFGWPAENELLRAGLHHAGWLAAVRMVREVGALQAVVGQGPTPPRAGRILAAGRTDARLPERLTAPVARALVESTFTLIGADDGLRARLEGSTPGAGLGQLRDGTAPVDHGLAATALDRGAAPGLVLTLAQPPAELARVLGPHLGRPDRPLPALIDAVGRCGLRCLPAIWSVLAHGRDLPATVAAISGHAPLEASLAEATGLAGVWLGDDFGGAVGHRAPATLDRAAWAPIVDAAGLESRWIVGDRAVLLTGRGAALAALEAAARSPAVTDAAMLRFTAVGVGGAAADRPLSGLRLEGALSFDRDGVALDVVVDRPPEPR